MILGQWCYVAHNPFFWAHATDHTRPFIPNITSHHSDYVQSCLIKLILYWLWLSPLPTHPLTDRRQLLVRGTSDWTRPSLVHRRSAQTSNFYCTLFYLIKSDLVPLLWREEHIHAGSEILFYVVVYADGFFWHFLLPLLSDFIFRVMLSVWCVIHTVIWSQ